MTALRLLLPLACVLITLWTSFKAHMAGQPMLALGLLAFGGIGVGIYATQRSLAWKYLFPGVAGMLVFMAVPLLVTVQMGFTNYSSAHLLTEERSRAYLLDQAEVDETRVFDSRVFADGGSHRVALASADGREQWLSAPFGAGGVVALQAGPAPAGEPLDLRALIALRPQLQALQLQLPDGTRLAYTGLREFGLRHPLYTAQPDGSLRARDGSVYRADRDSGFFTSPSGDRLLPGFKVGIGWAHYERMLFDADFRGPFVAIFVWTVAFAGLTVLFTTALGLALAVVLEWEALRGRSIYRTLLFLPYAVPGFISILVFKGLFNQNFGEINAILDALFGIRPAWFADPLLAKAMLLIVNTWLGYPYVMVLASGLIKSIPADLYEASAIAGAGPLTNFFRITAPLIARPLAPLLVASFAFNFNNFVLISLLTDGRPDFLNTKLPAGTNDILVSYTYRIAFTDAGQNFGLAAAISTLIFVMVAVMAIVQLRLTRQQSSR
ncbi:MAG: maltose ABC transporter permease MalF [Rubrivivax sp.]|nr:maltose ABC transporter permease MalF [Rubrivivax sp.]